MSDSTRINNIRISNKIDNISNWSTSAGHLLSGELAIAVIPSGTYTNPVTGKTEPAVEVLMKIGDGTKTFAALPWLSAKAADVYSWAKNEYAKDVPVTIIKGEDSSATTSTLGTWLKTVYDQGIVNASKISANLADITKLEGDSKTVGSIAYTLKTALDALNVTTSSGSGNFVTAVTQANGKISVKKGNISVDQLPSGISFTKIGSEDNTLDKVIANIESQLAAMPATVLESLDYSYEDTEAESTSNTTKVKFVTQVTQNNGQIAVKNRTIQTADLPMVNNGKISDGAVTNAKIKDGAVTRAKIADGAITDAKVTSVSADKVTVSTDVTLSDKLTSIDGQISGIDQTLQKLDGVEKDVMTSIEDEISGLNHTISGSGSFVKDVTQIKGIVTVSKGNLPTASSTTAGITKVGASGGAASYTDVANLTTRVGTAETKITNCQNSLTTQNEQLEDLTDRVAALEKDSHVHITSWKGVQEIVRAGKAQDVFSVGDQLNCQYNGQTLTWDIIGIDHDIPADSTKTHSLTLQLHNCLNTPRMFDNSEPTNPDESIAQNGNNDWSKSAIRQWLNSYNVNGTWWTAQHQYDAAPDYANIPGFLAGMDEDFLEVIGEVKKTTLTHKYYDGNQYIDGGSLKETVDKFFLLSVTEAYGGTVSTQKVDGSYFSLSEGEAYPYYSEYSTLPGPGEDSDSNRQKYLISNGTSLAHWWLRSGLYTNNVAYLMGGGKLTYSKPNSSVIKNICVSPACCIV